MNDRSVQLPAYVKASLVIIGLYFFVSMLHLTKEILVPLVYATFLAIALSPVVDFLERKRFNRTLAIALVLTVTSALVIALVGLLAMQASNLSKALPQLLEKFQALVTHLVSQISQIFDISVSDVDMWVEKSAGRLLDYSSSAIGSTLFTMGKVLSAAILTPVYTFLILFYQRLLTSFILQLFNTNDSYRVKEIMTQTRYIVQRYLSALLLQSLIVAVLDALGLFILGIDYAILLGIMGGLFNVIPYLGGVFSMVLFAVIALLTKEPQYAIYVVLLYSGIQIIDNNYVVPRVLGSMVKLNALVSIVAVIVGAALWDVAGMFLSIPIIAIIKLILDRIEPFKPYGFLLGSDVELIPKIRFKFSVKGFGQK